MATTTEYLNAVPTKSVSKPIVQLHPIINEKPVLPDHIRQSIKYWKSELDNWQQESNCLSKLLKWDTPSDHSVRGKLIGNRFKKLTTLDLPRFVESVNEIEKEIFRAIMDDSHEIKKTLIKYQKLEKELKAFKTKLGPIKLEILKQVSNKSPIKFF